MTVGHVRPSSSPRLWEVDALSGVAILMMIIYHAAWDLDFWDLVPLQAGVGPWRVFARPTAILFIFLVGLSLTLSYTAIRARHPDRPAALYYAQRGLRIIGWGMVITIVTRLAVGEAAVLFGILHFIGSSIILSYPLLRFRLVNLALGAVTVVAGLAINRVTLPLPWLLWIGLPPTNWYTVDYFPLMPWFGVVLLGIFTGNTLYTRGVRHFDLPNLSLCLPVRALSFLGRQSLAIYLIHQPLLLTVLTAVRLALGRG